MRPAAPQTLKFLFLDSHTIEYARGFTRQYGSATKLQQNPVLRPVKPHEFRRIHLYGTALWDDEASQFKLWYSTHSYASEAASYLCYATSEDGLVWDRPELDAVPGTNIVLDSDRYTHGPSVLRDAAEVDPSRRYKLLMRPRSASGIHGIVAMVSADGIHWRAQQDEPVIAAPSDSHIGLYRDRQTGLYRASCRARSADRRVWLCESADFREWTRPALIVEPDGDDSPQTQIYGMQMSPYGSYVLGWLSMYRTREEDMGWSKMEGTMDCQLAYSRDGHCWHRGGRDSRLIPVGEPGAWDAGGVIPSTAPVYLPEEIRFYYSGMPWSHNHGQDDESLTECMGAASLRPDGFVGLRAGSGGGEILTRPFAAHGPDIRVNADARGGEIRIEVCDAAGQAIDGLGAEDCLPLTGDGVSQEVSWKREAAAGAMVRRPIRLRILARRAELYSVSLPNGSQSQAYWDFREIGCLKPMLDLED